MLNVETADIFNVTRGPRGRYNECWDTHSSHLKLSQRLREEIGHSLSDLFLLIEKQKTFQHLDNYKGFLTAKLAICTFVQPLYEDAVIRFQLRGINPTNRVDEIRLDMADLEISNNSSSVALKCLPYGNINRLGWLYVVENLDRQSANWRRSVHHIGLNKDYGARHLAKGNGCATRWLSITKMFDNLRVSEVEEERIFAGARSASSLVAKTFSSAFDVYFLARANPSEGPAMSYPDNEL